MIKKPNVLPNVTYDTVQQNITFLMCEKDKDLLPHRGSERAVGHDLKADGEYTLKPNTTSLIGTGVRLSLPLNVEGQVRSRSGLALKNSLFVLNSPGTVDPDYTGEVKVILHNLGTKDFKIKRGDRIAQIVFNKTATEPCVFTFKDKTFEDVEVKEGERGSKGFGSTGVSSDE